MFGYQKGKVAKKPWVSEAMIERMSERRKWKANNTEEGRKEYRRVNNVTKRI